MQEPFLIEMISLKKISSFTLYNEIRLQKYINLFIVTNYLNDYYYQQIVRQNRRIELIK